MTFGEKLLNLRKEKGLSQEALADKLNVSRQAVSKWEIDESKPDTQNIIEIAEFFNCSIDYLLKDKIECRNEIEEEENSATEETITFEQGVCLKCGAKNDINAKFCKECGEKLVAKELGICPHCGAKNDTNAKFCNECGESIVGFYIGKAEKTNKPKIIKDINSNNNPAIVLKYLPVSIVALMFVMTVIFSSLAFVMGKATIAGQTAVTTIGGFAMIAEIFNGGKNFKLVGTVIDSYKGFAIASGILFLLIAIVLVVILINIIFSIGRYNKKTITNKIIMASILTALSLATMIVYCVWASKQTVPNMEIDISITYFSMTIPMFALNVVCLIGLCITRFSVKEELICDKALVKNPSVKCTKILSIVMVCVLVVVLTVVLLVTFIEKGEPAERLWNKFVEGVNDRNANQIAETIYPKDSDEYNEFLENYETFGDLDLEDNILGSLNPGVIGGDLGSLGDLDLNGPLGSLGNIGGIDWNLVEDFAFDCRNVTNVTTTKFEIVENDGHYITAHVYVELTTSFGNSKKDFNVYFVKKGNNALYFTTLPNFKNGNVIDTPVYIQGDVLKNVFDKEITDYEIPSGVKRIEANAFKDCTKLESIIIPSSVESIGEGAFSGCDNLYIYCYSFNIPSSWDDNWNCNRPFYLGISENRETGSVYIGNIEYQIAGDYAVVIKVNESIKQARILSKVSINGNEYVVTGINERAFALCYDMTSVIIPNTITVIDEYAFVVCKSLESVTIPSSVESIGLRAFHNCTNLTRVVFEKGSKLTVIRDNAFSNCESLVSITIPKSVKEIGYAAFVGCFSLKVINCEVESKPNTWDAEWNAGIATEWGC